MFNTSFKSYKPQINTSHASFKILSNFMIYRSLYPFHSQTQMTRQRSRNKLTPAEVLCKIFRLKRFKRIMRQKRKEHLKNCVDCRRKGKHAKRMVYKQIKLLYKEWEKGLMGEVKKLQLERVES